MDQSSSSKLMKTKFNHDYKENSIDEIQENFIENPQTSIIINSAKDNDEETSKLIIVTGFGPFIGHELVNASWEAVRILPDRFQHHGHIYNIKKFLVSVEYDKVDEAVDEIWKNNPVLVIHCGVHGGAKSILLESLAYNNKFIRSDYGNKRLPYPSVCLQKNGNFCDRICTKLNVKDIAKNVNEIVEKKNDECLQVSNDVGNYLCGYIYLKSLDINCNRSLFIHVPPIDKPFSSEETSNIIFNVIQECVKQIEMENDETGETCAAQL